MSELIKFTKQDVDSLKQLGALLVAKARFSDLSIPEAVNLNRLLQAYNQITIKVEDHILEVLKVTPEVEEEPAPAKGKRK